MKREILSFVKTIQPNTTEILKERIKDNGTVEEVRIRFYAGVERSLKVRPYVMHDNRKPEDIFTYPEGTDKYITGDDDYLDFPVSVDVELDDEMVIWVNNDNLSYPYTLAVFVVVSYAYGESGI